MNRFLVVGFQFYETFNYSLINCKAKQNGTEYRITVMNGELEKLLFGTNTLQEINGCLYFEVPENKQQEKLKTEIVRSLSRVIGIPFKEVKKTEEAGK